MISTHLPARMRKSLAVIVVLPSIYGAGHTQVAMCKSCKIEVSNVAILGTSDGGGSLGPSVHGKVWDVDSHGRFWIGSETEVVVFDRRGRFVHKVGRTGEGPGEFRHISAVVGVPGDSIVVIDEVLGRASLFDTQGRLSRIIRLNERLSIFEVAIVRWPKDVVVNAVGYGEASIGWPLHVFDFSGQEAARKRSFGDTDGSLVFGHESKLQRIIGVGSDRNVWAVPLFTLAMKHWSADGHELPHSFTLRAEWLSQEAQPMPLGNPSTPPARFNRAVWIDSDRNLIWVAAWIPRRDWREAWRHTKPLPNRGEVAASDLPAPEQLWQTRIDVIDPRLRRSIANATTPLLFDRLSSAGLAAARAEARDGTPRVRIVRLALTGQPNR